MSRRYILLIASLLILLPLGGGILLTRARAMATPEQPIPYSHQVHIQAEMQCLFCHPNALRSPIAGIPSVQKCMDCHQVIATEKPAIQPLREYWTNGEPIPWVRVNPQPEFVYFSHQVHILAPINCETCHGNVAQMDAIRPVERMDMGWCLNCHLKQPEEKVSRLTDCVTCHK